MLEEFPINSIGVMQAFTFNIRRDKFKDPRVRLAFNYLFEFEEMNKKIFFGQYKRIASYFEGTDLAATGLPTGRELELLETVRDKVPPELFQKPYTNPVGGGQTEMRVNMRDAIRLFREAGYEVREQQLVNAKTGEPFSVEMLANTPSFERVFLFYKPVARAARHRRVGAHGRRGAVRKPAARLGFRHDHLHLAGIAAARQRAARLLGLAGRRPVRARRTSSASRTRRSMR